MTVQKMKVFVDHIRYIIKCIDKYNQMYILSLLNKLYGEILKHRDDIDIMELSNTILLARSYIIQSDLHVQSKSSHKCIINVLQKAINEYERKVMGECLTLMRLTTSDDCGTLSQLPNDIQRMIINDVKMSHPSIVGKKLHFADE